MADECFLLLPKLERVLFDLDFVYVNLLKIIRNPKASTLPKQAANALQAKYDLLSQNLI